MLNIAESHILSIDPYLPSSASEHHEHIKSWAHLGSNENCLGASQRAIEAGKKALLNSHRYPIANRLIVIEKICQHLQNFNVKNHEIALGNGTSEIIANLVRGLIAPNEQILFSWPSFIMYRLAAQIQGRKYITIKALDDLSYNLDAILNTANDANNNIKLIIIANPNNPTGNYVSHDSFKNFILNLKKDIVIAIDEAYYEYVANNDYKTSLELALSRPRTIVLRTFSKIYGLAGLRLGYAIGDQNVISILQRVQDPFNINNVVQNASIAALEDKDHINRSIAHNNCYKPLLLKSFREMGFYAYDSVCNFILIKRPHYMMDMATLSQKLWAQGIVVKTLDIYGMHDYLRISVGTNKEIAQLFYGLKEIINKAKKPLLLR